MVLRSINAVPDKDDRRFYGCLFGVSLVRRNIVVGELQRNLRAGVGNKTELRLFGISSNAEEVDVLKKRSIVARGQQAIALELFGNPVSGHISALLSGAATLKRVVREIFDRSADPFRINGFHGPIQTA